MEGAFSSTLGSYLQSNSPEYIERTLQNIQHLLPLHGMAFEKDIISCARLVQVLAPPFLKLARNACNETPASSYQMMRVLNSDNTFCMDLLMAWKMALAETLLGLCCDGKQSQVGHPVEMALNPRKRAEFVKALIDTKFPEVNLTIIRGFLQFRGSPDTNIAQVSPCACLN